MCVIYLNIGPQWKRDFYIKGKLWSLQESEWKVSLPRLKYSLFFRWSLQFSGLKCFNSSSDFKFLISSVFSNILTLTLTLCPINCGVLTSLLLSHLSSSLKDTLPSLNLLCYSKADARFMQDGSKAVWSIPYVSVAFFPYLKQNFIAYSSSNIYYYYYMYFWNSPAVTIRL